MENIIVLGAGTAGLVSALIIKKSFPLCNVTVIESDSIGIIGVGEGSTEHWRIFAEYCGISMQRLVRETHGTLKKGIKFENWNGDGKSYFHAIVDPFYSEYTSADDLSEKLTFIKTLIGNNIKTEDVLNETNLINTSFGLNSVNQYQFNTFKLNEFLHKVCEEASINFVKTTVTDVMVSDNGDVSALVGESGTLHNADFFIDSSGFKRIISTKLGSKWVSYKKYLPMNHALAFPTENITELKPYTLSKALSSGWNWRIPTQGRYGNGYVFCDDFINATQAHDEIQSHYSEKVNVAKDIKFDAGRVDQFWINNCVSIGLSASFVEPLEASSIGNSIMQAFGFVRMLPVWEVERDKITKQYNKRFTECFDNIVDFIQIHYLGKRKDSDFWKTIPEIMTVTDFNKEHLDIWKKTLPSKTYFLNEYNLFNAYSYAQVMAGMDMFDREYILQNLTKTYGEKLVEQELMKYNSYLEDIQVASYIDHKVLLEQNNIVVKFDYIK
jgi:tryptophan halogenase